MVDQDLSFYYLNVLNERTADCQNKEKFGPKSENSMNLGLGLRENTSCQESQVSTPNQSVRVQFTKLKTQCIAKQLSWFPVPGESRPITDSKQFTTGTAISSGFEKDAVRMNATGVYDYFDGSVVKNIPSSTVKTDNREYSTKTPLCLSSIKCAEEGVNNFTSGISRETLIVTTGTTDNHQYQSHHNHHQLVSCLPSQSQLLLNYYDTFRMASTSGSSSLLATPPPSYLGVLYVATAGQNGPNLGVDEEEIVLVSLAIVQREGKKLLSTTNFLVHPRGTVKSAPADINENNNGENGILSEECRIELGLTDEDIKQKGKPLEDVISELDAIIKRHVAPYQISSSSPSASIATPSIHDPLADDEAGNECTETTSENPFEKSTGSSSLLPSPLPFAFITEGQLPLRQSVHPEASTKEIRLPDHYYSFFDLKKEFCSCYDDAHQGIESVQEMVKFLELKLSKEEDEETDEEKMSKKTSDEPRLTDNQENAAGENEADVESSPSPGKAEEGSSSKSVTGDESKVIKPYSYKRRITEMAAVVMRMLEDATTFQRSEIIMKKLEPGICSKNECVDGNCVVRARGLPWQSSDQDIARFFRGLNIAKGGVALCLSPQGRRNGEALIRFESQEHRDMALKRHKHHIANRYIEVYKASGEDFLSVAGGNNNEAQAFLSKGGQVIVRMRGLPYDCTAKQVVEFFDSGDNACKVLDGEEGVLFVKRPDGRATGDAFVQFQHEDDASNALGKHRESIGSRYIELFRSTTAEVQQVLNRCIISAAAAAAAAQANSSQNTQNEPLLKTLPPHALAPDLLGPGPGSLPLMTPTGQIVQPSIVSQPQAGNNPSGHILPQHIITSGTRKDCIRLRGLPYEAQVEHILEFLGEHAKNIVYQGVHMVYNAQGQPSGEAFIQMDSEHSAYLAAQSKHHRYMHHFKKQRYIEVFQCSGDDMNLVLTGGVVPKNSIHAAAAAAAAAHLHPHHPAHVVPQLHHPGPPQQLNHQPPPLIPTLPIAHHPHHPHPQLLLQHQTSTPSPQSSTSPTTNSSTTSSHHQQISVIQQSTTSSATSSSSILATVHHQLAPPPPPQAQYYTPHTAVLSAIPRNTPGAAGATAYYHPAAAAAAATVFYWPYPPSPPVSPTYYSHAAATAGGIVQPTGHPLGIVAAAATNNAHHPHHQAALLPPPHQQPDQLSSAPQPQQILKHYHHAAHPNQELRILDISNTGSQAPHRQEYISIDPSSLHHHHPSHHHHPHSTRNNSYIEKNSQAYRHHHQHHHHQTLITTNGASGGSGKGSGGAGSQHNHHHHHHHHPHPGTIHANHHPHHHHHGGATHYMMELGLFMA